jgi:hypothetical protein
MMYSSGVCPYSAHLRHSPGSGTFLASLSDSSTDSITPDVAFELSKRGQHSGERATRWRGHIEGLGQVNSRLARVGRCR